MSFISKNTARRVLFARALEPRFMLDGAALATAIDAAPPPAEAPAAEAAEQSSTETLVASLAPADPDAGPTGSDVLSAGEITFVDSGIANFEQLISGLPEGMEVIVIDSSRDGVAQISEALAGRSGLSAIHIVSHGDDGTAQLGNTLLTAETIDGYAAQIAGWGDALDAEADILFYGCNLAATADGENLVNELSSLTGADIAASSDITGAAAQAGNWTLEYTTGSIETALPFSAASLDAFDGTLFVIDTFGTAQVLTTGGPTAGTVVDATNITGSEREATITATSGVGVGTLSINTAVAGSLSIDNATASTSQTVLLYNGVGAAGLGGLDATDGGTQDAFALSVTFADRIAQVTISATSGTTTGALTVATPGDIFGVFPGFGSPTTAINFGHANFVTTAGPGNVDFTSLDSITVTVNTNLAANDVTIDFFETSTTPGFEPNIAPVITVPVTSVAAPIASTPNVALALTGANLVSIADNDISQVTGAGLNNGDGRVTATVSVNNGATLTVDTPAGLAITGNGTASVTFTNQLLTDVNTALAGLTFLGPNAGASVITVNVDDLGNTSTPLNALQDTEVININVAAPVIGPGPDPAPPVTSNIGQQFGNGAPNTDTPYLPSIIIDDFLTLEDSALYIGHSVNERGDSIDNQYGANSVAIVKNVDPTEAVASTTGAQYASVGNVLAGGATGDSSLSGTSSSSSSIGNTPASIGAALSNIAPSAGNDGQVLTPEELEILRQAAEQAGQPEAQSAPAEDSTPPAEGSEPTPTAPNANGASFFPNIQGVPGLSTQMETVAAEFGLRRDGLLAAFAQTRTEPAASEMNAA